MLYPAERFEDYGNCCYLESDSFIVTWAMGHLFRISEASEASLSRQEMEGQIESMSRDYKICPDWDFEFLDVSKKRHFEMLKVLINSPV